MQKVTESAQFSNCKIIKWYSCNCIYHSTLQLEGRKLKGKESLGLIPGSAQMSCFALAMSFTHL